MVVTEENLRDSLFDLIVGSLIDAEYLVQEGFVSEDLLNSILKPVLAESIMNEVTKFEADNPDFEIIKVECNLPEDGSEPSLYIQFLSDYE